MHLLLSIHRNWFYNSGQKAKLIIFQSFSILSNCKKQRWLQKGRFYSKPVHVAMATPGCYPAVIQLTAVQLTAFQIIIKTRPTIEIEPLEGNPNCSTNVFSVKNSHWRIRIHLSVQKQGEGWRQKPQNDIKVYFS